MAAINHLTQKTKTLILGVVSLVLAYIMICFMFYMNQEAMIFIGANDNPDFEQFWQGRHQTASINEQKLEYWHIKNPEQPPGWLIYFGGNAENVVYNLPMFDQLAVANVVAVNYRGYGNSSGEPSEKDLLADALGLYDHLAKKFPSEFHHIRVMGRSLGTSVAAYVAANRQVAGAILVSPFDGLNNVAKSHFPWLPVTWLLKHRFEVHRYIENKKLPNLLMITGDSDRVIPNIFSESLFQQWQGAKSRVKLPGNHNTLTQSLGYYPSINNYVAIPPNQLDPQSEIKHANL